MNQIIPADFFGTQLSIIDHDGRRWLTAEQVGIALGFAPSNARKGILKLYERHQAEFTEADTFVVNLTSNSPGNPNTRIFSATGCVLLSFFAQTKRAAAFRAWAKEHLAAARQGLSVDEIPAITRKAFAERDAARAALLSARPDWEKAIRYRAAGLTYTETGLLLGISADQVTRRYRAIREAGLLLAAPRQRLSGAALVSHRRATDRARAEAAQGALALEGGDHA